MTIKSEVKKTQVVEIRLEGVQDWGRFVALCRQVTEDNVRDLIRAMGGNPDRFNGAEIAAIFAAIGGKKG